MIKVTIPEKKLDLPMLMATENGDTIILANYLDPVQNVLEGVVIRSKHWITGYHSTDWEASELKPYTGAVTLENQETT